jgi:YD repeat-containing protein
VKTFSLCYTYDANGNTLTDASGRTFTWDFENRLIQAVVPGTNGGTTTFRYDPFGRRIYKESPNFTSVFLHDGSNLIETVNASGSEVAGYTQGLGVDEMLAMQRGGTTDHYDADGLGSITSLSSSAGALANTYIYDSFGYTTASTAHCATTSSTRHVSSTRKPISITTALGITTLPSDASRLRTRSSSTGE